MNGITRWTASLGYLVWRPFPKIGTKMLRPEVRRPDRRPPGLFGNDYQLSID